MPVDIEAVADAEREVPESPLASPEGCVSERQEGLYRCEGGENCKHQGQNRHRGELGEDSGVLDCLPAYTT